MRRLLFAILLLAAMPARADWSYLSAYPLDTGFGYTARFDWTTTLSPSTGLDMRDAKLSYAFDPSTGDSSTDATYSPLGCPSASSSSGECRLIQRDPADSAYAGTFNGPSYFMVLPKTATAGGDTARFYATVEISDLEQCLDVTTTLGTTDDAVFYMFAGTGKQLDSVLCITDTGTASINLEERDPQDPTTAGTSLLSSSLSCDTDGAFSRSFAQEYVGPGMIGSVRISSVSSNVRVIAYCKTK